MDPTGGRLVLAFLLITVIETTRSVPTYQRKDKETGKMVICQQCPPGSFVAKHCTSRSTTECQPCPNEHYTQYWNYLDKCRFCNVICQDREQLKHQCNATHNRVCECQPGYRRDSHFCVPECSLLSWLINNGDPECGKTVIEPILKQNTSDEMLKLIENKLAKNETVNPKRIRILFKCLRDFDPEHPWLHRILEALNKAGLHSLEKKLKKKCCMQNHIRLLEEVNT